MIRDKKCHLLAKSSLDEETYQTIASEDAGWKYLNFTARTMKQDRSGKGKPAIMSTCLCFSEVIFQQKPRREPGKHGTEEKMYSADCHMHCIFLPILNLIFSLQVILLDIACGWCLADKKYPARLISPADVVEMGVEFRGAIMPAGR